MGDDAQLARGHPGHLHGLTCPLRDVPIDLRQEPRNSAGGRPEPIAAIGVYWADTHAATDNAVGALILLADSAALALTNVRLYDKLAAALR